MTKYEEAVEQLGVTLSSIEDTIKDIAFVCDNAIKKFGFSVPPFDETDQLKTIKQHFSSIEKKCTDGSHTGLKSRIKRDANAAKNKTDMFNVVSLMCKVETTLINIFGLVTNADEILIYVNSDYDKEEIEIEFEEIASQLDSALKLFDGVDKEFHIRHNK